MIKPLWGYAGTALLWLVCAAVAGQRFELSAEAGELGFSRARIGAVVPPGHVLAFGETPGSIDSRYSVVGAVNLEDAALGVSAPLPSKKSLRALAQMFAALAHTKDAL